jgi:hypothetical protein
MTTVLVGRTRRHDAPSSTPHRQARAFLRDAQLERGRLMTIAERPEAHDRSRLGERDGSPLDHAARCATPSTRPSSSWIAAPCGWPSATPTGAGSSNQWAKQAILLYFRLTPNFLSQVDAPGPYWDKIPLKFAGWDAGRFEEAGFRAVPGCIVRRGAYIARNVVMTPSFVNIGAYVDEGTMVDTWATVGSCAQIGKNCHISGGAGIGGVLEPLQANPTIIEDNCFIGARSEVAEGVIVREGSVLSMGVT